MYESPLIGYLIWNNNLAREHFSEVENNNLLESYKNIYSIV